MRRLGWTDVVVPLVALGAVTGFAYLSLFGGDDARSGPRERIQASAAAKAEAARLPGCTGKGAPANFSVFTLGPRFAGRSQAAALRRCDRPELYPAGVAMATAGGDRHAFRANFASFIYGDCAAGDDEGCAPPLEIQTWPACERNAGSSEKAVRTNLRIRGAPAAVSGGGTEIEIYTARSTVVVFGEDRGLTMRAARAAAPMAVGARFPANVSAAGVRVRSKRPLARPARGAMSGRLRCRQVSASSRAGV